MGQQQLLLIVLGVIIVGIAVVVGINLFNANAEESTKDTLVSEGTNLGAMAQQYFKKPVALGGGGNDFCWIYNSDYLGNNTICYLGRRYRNNSKHSIYRYTSNCFRLYFYCNRYGYPNWNYFSSKCWNLI